jgi:molybdopterin-binding protein
MTVSERNQLRGQLKIKVINHGNLPVIIESFYLTRLPDGKGEQRKLRISVAESEKLPLTIQAGASEIFTSSIYQNINLLQAGNDVICVEASDGKIVSSSVCKDLTKIGEWMSQDEYE